MVFLIQKVLEDAALLVVAILNISGLCLGDRQLMERPD